MRWLNRLMVLTDSPQKHQMKGREERVHNLGRDHLRVQVNSNLWCKHSPLGRLEGYQMQHLNSCRTHFCKDSFLCKIMVAANNLLWCLTVLKILVIDRAVRATTENWAWKVWGTMQQPQLKSTGKASYSITNTERLRKLAPTEDYSKVLRILWTIHSPWALWARASEIRLNNS